MRGDMVVKIDKPKPPSGQGWMLNQENQFQSKTASESEMSSDEESDKMKSCACISGKENHSISSSKAFEGVTIEKISSGFFYLVKFQYPRSVKYYIGECTRKSKPNSFIFFKHLHDLFAYKDNVVEETISVASFFTVLSSPAKSQHVTSMDFKSPSKLLNFVDLLSQSCLCG